MKKEMLPIIATLVANSVFAQVSIFDAGWKNMSIVTKATELKTTTTILQYTGANQTFTVDTNMDWSGKPMFIIGSGNTNLGTPVIQIEEGSTLTLSNNYGNTSRLDTTIKFQGAGAFGYSSKDIFYVTNNGGITGNVTKQIYDYTGLTSGWSLNGKNVTINDGNSILAGNASVTETNFYMNGNSSFTTTSTSTIFGSLTMSGNSVFNAANLTSGNSKFTMSDNAQATLGNAQSSINLASSSFSDNSKITLGSTIFTVDGSTLTLASGTGSVVATAWIFKSGTVNFNATDVLASQTQSQSELRLALARSNITFNINANQNFGEIDLYRNSASTTGDVLTINMGGNYDLVINSLLFGASTSKVLIYDFVEDLIYVGNELATNADKSLLNVYAMVGTTETKLYQLNNGYLTMNIPEPAEWAAIFGAFALALAIYRRKK